MTEQHPAVAFLQQAWSRAELAARGHGSPVQIDYLMVCGPAAVLRRIEAERELLAEHEPTWPGGEPEYGHHYETAISETTGRSIYVEVRDDKPAPPYWCETCQAMAPCRTVLLLAQAWGWEATP